MFGCAFLTNETTKSFEWLFKEFLESMGDKKPITIFTDQDCVIAAAIKKVFGKDTRHRLCLWHIQQNASNNCAELKKNDELKNAFTHYLSGCRSEEEFENSWEAMIEKYKLRDHHWFQKIYEAHEKWCTGLNTDFFPAGILSSQRSESTNHAILFKATKTTSLTQFFQIFGSIVDHWRSNEKLHEFNSSRSTPNLKILGQILKDAAKVYTPTIFKYFQKEFLYSIGTKAIESCRIGKNVIYNVSPYEEPTKIHSVCFCNANDKVMVSCSCKHFEEVGLLCMHCIRILHLNNVPSIPADYILKRRTKEAKMEVWDRMKQQQSTTSKLPDSLVWRHQMIRTYTNLVIQSEGNMDSRRVLEDGFGRDYITVQQFLKHRFTLQSRRRVRNLLKLPEKYLIQIARKRKEEVLE